MVTVFLVWTGGVGLAWSFCDGDLKGVAGGFVDLCTDGFGNAYDVADRAVGVFNSHVYYGAVIGYFVKGGVYLDSALAEFRFYVVGKLDIGGVHVGSFLDYGFKFICFGIHGL